MTNRSIWWIRRDLRLDDNPTLAASLADSKEVYPVFILDRHLLSSPYTGEKRIAFLFANLHALDTDLRQRGSYLILRAGDPLEELTRLVEEIQATAIFIEADVSPYARQRDERIARHLPLQLSGNPAIHPPGSVLKTDGLPYTVFTPFSKAWKALPSGLLESKADRAPQHIPTPQAVASLHIPTTPPLSGTIPFPPGADEGQRRLQAFTSELSAGIYRYATERDRVDLPGTSNLSPYLRFGLLSARRAASAAYQAIQAAPDPTSRRSAETWLNELIWRDFYFHTLYHFPQVRRENFHLRRLQWENNLLHFEAWKVGQTGYPIVDAAMRQLEQTGWMHNRSRMIVASFLTKDLLVDWRRGERWFMQHLIDGDPAANNGGWQWTAGTGADAAPYFRIFNPILQSTRYDPRGIFIRRWLPELAGVPPEYIHEPWKMPLEVQLRAGCRIGKEYPAPIIDHAWARDRALSIYKKQDQLAKS